VAKARWGFGGGAGQRKEGARGKHEDGARGRGCTSITGWFH
jgi:hypothetical protein